MGKNRKPHHAKLPAATELDEVAAVSSDQSVPLAAGTESPAADVVNTEIVQVAENASGDVAECDQDDQGECSNPKCRDGYCGGAKDDMERDVLPAEFPAAEPVPSPFDTVALYILGTINETSQDPATPANPPSSTESSETGSIDPVPEIAAEQLEPAIAVVDDGYIPLMTLENIAQAANEAAQAVAIQAGFFDGFSAETLDQTLIAAKFVRQWPESPVSAMVIHVCRAKKRPTVEYDSLPTAVQLALRVMRLVMIECFAAEREHGLKFERNLLEEARQAVQGGVFREDLAMTPDDDNPLSELGRAAARG